MEFIANLVPLRDYCRKNSWPRLPQWNYWIQNKHPIAKACVKKIGSRYLIDTQALEKHIQNASIDN